MTRILMLKNYCGIPLWLFHAISWTHVSCQMPKIRGLAVQPSFLFATSMQFLRDSGSLRSLTVKGRTAASEQHKNTQINKANDIAMQCHYHILYHNLQYHIISELFKIAQDRAQISETFEDSRPCPPPLASATSKDKGNHHHHYHLVQGCDVDVGPQLFLLVPASLHVYIWP